jgi:hypothetical protein
MASLYGTASGLKRSLYGLNNSDQMAAELRKNVLGDFASIGDGTAVVPASPTSGRQSYINSVYGDRDAAVDYNTAMIDAQTRLAERNTAPWQDQVREAEKARGADYQRLLGLRETDFRNTALQNDQLHSYNRELAAYEQAGELTNNMINNTSLENRDRTRDVMGFFSQRRV